MQMTHNVREYTVSRLVKMLVLFIHGFLKFIGLVKNNKWKSYDAVSEKNAQDLQRKEIQSWYEQLRANY